MNRPRAVAFAIGTSFSVYLIPLVGRHGVWLLGEVLSRGAARDSPQWMAANWAVALTIQVFVAGLMYWFFRKPGWSHGIVPLAVIPFVISNLQWIYQVAIPIRFLEEPDTATEAVSWPVACTAPAVFQMNLRTDSELWVRFSSAPNNYAVLTMPDCRVHAVRLPQPTLQSVGSVDFMIDPTFAVSGGRAVVQKYYTKESRQTWWVTPGSSVGDATLLPLDPPPGRSGNDGSPILSTDGQWAAWMETIPNTVPPVLNRVVLRPREPREQERAIDLSSLGFGSYSLQKLDMQSEELLLWKNDHLMGIGLDGALKKEFARPANVRPQQQTYVPMGEYWLAWDAYRDNTPYRIEWSLPSGSGLHRVPLGRTIHSTAIDSSGKWIAVSVGTSLNIGNGRDAVYVLSSSDGREVFRKFLPRYTRSPVAFFENGFFAFSDLSGVQVYRLPD